MRVVLSLALGATLVAGCGGDDEGAGDGRPTVVVTTSILGDIVAEVLGDAAEVEVLLPLGADPHSFSPSARQAEALEDADLVVVTGAGFEAGLETVVDAAEERGTPVFAFADHVELLELGDDHGHDHGDAGDPHFWLDPVRTAAGVAAFGERAAELPGLDAAAVRAGTEAYLEELSAADEEVEEVLAAVPDERRVLVTNHEVLASFADRYGFRVVGAVIPSLTTDAEASAADVEDLAELLVTEDVPAIFAETTQSSDLADALADASGTEVEVVELFTESLGDEGSGAETYLELLRTDAQRIADALAG